MRRKRTSGRVARWLAAAVWLIAAGAGLLDWLVDGEPPPSRRLSALPTPAKASLTPIQPPFVSLLNPQPLKSAVMGGAEVILQEPSAVGLVRSAGLSGGQNAPTRVTGGSELGLLPEVRSEQDRSDKPTRRKPLEALRVRREVFTVTAYCPCRRCCGKWAGDGMTASGMPITYNGGRFVAADTRVLPFFTRVRVPGYANGQPVPVIDRGGKVRGRCIDVFFPTHRQAQRWGKKKLVIEILE